MVTENTRGENQTDHVFAICNPLLYDVSAIVCPGVGDHCEMHVKIRGETLCHEEQKWQQRRVVVNEGDPVIIDMMLKNQLGYLTRSFVDNLPLINQSVLDDMLSCWVRTVEEVRKGEQETIVRTFPTGPGRLQSKEVRQVQFCQNKLSNCYEKLKKGDASAEAEILTEIKSWKEK